MSIMDFRDISGFYRIIIIVVVVVVVTQHLYDALFLHYKAMYIYMKINIHIDVIIINMIIQI